MMRLDVGTMDKDLAWNHGQGFGDSVIICKLSFKIAWGVKVLPILTILIRLIVLQFNSMNRVHTC